MQCKVGENGQMSWYHKQNNNDNNNNNNNNKKKKKKKNNKLITGVINAIRLNCANLSTITYKLPDC